MLNSSGQETQHIRYDQYGNVISVNGSAPMGSYSGTYPSEQAVTVTDPSFESGLTGWSLAVGSSGGAAVVSSASLGLSQTPDGTHAVDVSASGFGTTTLVQTVGTVTAGSTYVLEAYEVGDPTGDSMDYTVELLAGNTVIGTSDDPQDGPQNANGQWFGVQVSGSVAPGSNLAGQALKIELIADGQGGNGGVLFDDGGR